MTPIDRPDLSVELARPYRPTRSGIFHLVTTVTAPEIADADRTARPPLNLSFIVDRSGSMSGGKFDLARQGVEYALGLLNKHDTVSLVVYDDTIDLLLSQRAAGRDAREKAIRRLRRIQPRGSTALAEGWATGCGQLASIADEDRRAVCRAILLTDGLANVGQTDPEALARDAGELARRGVTTTTFGVGDQFDEVLLAGIADSGRGRYHYIANSSGIVPVFAGELGELLHITMREARLSVTLPDGWSARVLNDLPLETSSGEVTVTLGDISSGDTRSVVWEFTVPDTAAGERQTALFSLEWLPPEGSITLEHSHAQVIEARNDPGPPNEAVHERLAEVLSARARAEALEHNRAGRYDQAASAIHAARSQMPASPAATRHLMELESFAGEVSAPLSAAELKAHHFKSRRASRSERDYSGTG